MDSYADSDAFVVDVDTTDAVEVGPVEAGEYKLQVVKAEGKSGTDKNGETWQGITLLYDIPEEMSAGLVNHMVFIPRKGVNTTDKQYNQSLGRFKEFKLAHGISDAETFSPPDLVGREVWAALSLKEDPEYGPQNRIQKFIVTH